MTAALDTDTIAATATAPGEGAIAIIRVAGPDSLSIADRIFQGRGPSPSRRRGQSFLHGTICGTEGVADEVILLIYRAPHSYTREDCIEIQGHGGTAGARRILRAVLDAGARLAEPGEFTKRAFLNGRLDLVQAEAVLDLIRAQSDKAATAALEQLDGTLSRAFNKLYDDTLALAADLEATLDFSEDELPQLVMNDVRHRFRTVESDLKRLLASWDEGHLLRDGALVVIAGKPNVGKSTLLNALLGKERAIVTAIAGTTRDTIEEHVVIAGYMVRLVDTAGLRASSCEIESEGIRRASDVIDKADLVIYVVDGTIGLDEEDQQQFKSRHGKKMIIAVNKIDSPHIDTTWSHAPDRSVRYISSSRGDGLDELKQAIVSQLGIHEGVSQQATISERHRRLLVSAHKEMVESALLLTDEVHEPALSASRLRSALLTLGEVTGRSYHDELLNNIFTRFCIGK